MAAIVPKYDNGKQPITRRCVAAVNGAMLVEARTSAALASDGAGLGVGPAAAGSAVVLGVALDDALPVGTGYESGTTVYGAAFVDTSVYPADVAIANDVIVPGVLYAASATPGQRLKAAANGSVTPWVSGTDNPQLIVGHCEEPQGVTGGARGNTYINIVG